MKNILLGVKRGKWRGSSDDPHDEPAFLDARGKALARDGGCCHFCDWQDDKWMEGHHKDDDHANNSPDNIVTCCTWCHRCHHVGLAGINEMGFIGLSPLPGKPLPSQPLLNQMVRLYDWATSVPNTPPKYQSWVAMFQEWLEISIKHAESVIGTSNPSELGDVLLNISEAQYKSRDELISGFRLIPTLLEELDSSVEEQRKEIERRQHWIQKLKARIGSPKP